MPSNAKTSFNPLPWVLTEIGFGQLSVPVRFPVETRLMALDALVIASTS